MNPSQTHPSAPRTLVKRALPYFIAAAVIINTDLMLIPIDMIRILIANVGIDGISPENTHYIASSIRTYGNIVLIAGIFTVSLRGLQERK